jgi:hypothetical protein
MKKVFLIIAIIIGIGFVYSCDSPGKKAAKEGMSCVESAIDNASSITEAQQSILKCQEIMKSKYQSKITNDQDFAKEFMESSKDWDKKIEEKLKTKFGSK